MKERRERKKRKKRRERKKREKNEERRRIGVVGKQKNFLLNLFSKCRKSLSKKRRFEMKISRKKTLEFQT